MTENTCKDWINPCWTPWENLELSLTFVNRLFRWSLCVCLCVWTRTRSIIRMKGTEKKLLPEFMVKKLLVHRESMVENKCLCKRVAKRRLQANHNYSSLKIHVFSFSLPVSYDFLNFGFFGNIRVKFK